MRNGEQVSIEAALADGATDDGLGAVRMSRYVTFADLGAAAGPLVGYLFGAYFGFGPTYGMGAVMSGLVLLALTVKTRR